jgi:TRAP transporter TAXI family solute receptor
MHFTRTIVPLIALFLTPVLLLSPVPAGETSSTKPAKLVTGLPGLYYDALGNALEALCARNGIQIKAQQSAGSLQNINELIEGHADLGIVQSDVAHWAWTPHFSFGPAGQKIKLVAPLYTESVHIVLRPHFYASSLGQLRDRRVWLGLSGSGSEYTAREVLKAAGLTSPDVDRIETVEKDMDTALTDLKGGKIDALFLISAVPAKVLADVPRNAEVRLMDLEPSVVANLVGQGYVATLIPQKPYERTSLNPGKETRTIGVQAMLLAREDPHLDSTVEMLAQLLGSKRREIENSLGSLKLNLLGVRFNKEKWKGHIHEKAVPYLPDPMRSAAVFAGFALAGVLALCIFLHPRRAKVSRLISENIKTVLVFAATGASWLTCAGFFYFSERDMNENFSAPFRSILYTIPYLTGFPAVGPPLTPSGKTVAEVAAVFKYILVAGIAIPMLMNLFQTDVVARLANWMQGRLGMPKELNGHIVIINWDVRTSEMIRQLLSFAHGVTRPIVLVSQFDVMFPSGREFESVICIMGDPTGKPCLEKARVQHAHSVTILSAWQPADPTDRRRKLDADTADSKTIMTILKIRSLCAELSVPTDVPISAEIRTIKNRAEAEEAGRGGEVEIVCLEDFGIEVLTQCAVTPGLAKLYKHLLTINGNTSDIYRTKVPEAYVGKYFSEMLQHFAGLRRNAAPPVIPLGVYRAPELYLNPPDEQLGPLRNNDSLFVLAEREPPW